MTWMSLDQEATQKFVRLVARLFTYARHGICLLSLYVQAVNVVFVFFHFLLGRKGWLIWTIKAFEISSQVFWRIWWLSSSACRACWSCWRRCHIIPEESIRYIDSTNRLQKGLEKTIFMHIFHWASYLRSVKFIETTTYCRLYNIVFKRSPIMYHVWQALRLWVQILPRPFFINLVN